jgi:ketosteroid isomerase-like protein
MGLVDATFTPKKGDPVTVHYRASVIFREAGNEWQAAVVHFSAGLPEDATTW